MAAHFDLILTADAAHRTAELHLLDDKGS